MKLSIVLLTWNSAQFVENCINSIYNSTNIKNFEIIIVDNDSIDDTLKILETKFLDIQIIKNTLNKGVAPARNQGISVTKGEYVLILDIDTIVVDGSIDRLITFMEQNLKVGVCGPKLSFEDGVVQYSCRRFPLLVTKLLRRVSMQWAQRMLADEYYLEQMQAGQPFEADYVIGACQLIRREALKDTGLLDNNIFYGPEDVDLCLRMWLHGWKVAYIPDAAVIHFEQRVTKKKFFSFITFKHIQGLIHYFIKHGYGISRKGIYRRIKK